jgi:DNA primase
MAVTKETVTKKVKILDIAKEFNISVEQASSGNFNFRCRCPSKEHKHGTERTPSLYIDSKKNNYYCFGCQSSTNCIDFYMICADVSFSDALSVLRKRVVGDSEETEDELTVDNLSYIMDISKLFRLTMLSHPDDLKWLNGLMKRTDIYLEKIKRSDIERVKELQMKLQEKIKERYSK